MEETKEESVNGKSEQSSEASFTWEEWTVVDEGENSSNRTTSQLTKLDDAASSETSFSDIDNASDAEEARECIEVILQRDSEQCPSAIADDNQSNEESDGVSVITESDIDEPVGDVNEGEIIVHENTSREVAMIHGDVELNNFRMIFVIVCSLLGVAIFCTAINSWTRRNSNDLDFVTKAKCNNVYESVKPSTDVNDVARERKSAMQKPILEETRIPYVKEYLKIIDSSINEPENAIFERLQIFQRTMCLLMEDIRYPESITRQSDCGKNSLLPHLMNLRLLLKSVVSELDAPERSVHERFLQKVELQIESMSNSLVTNFARALDKLTAKNHNKLEKISVKLAERLCLLRNTLPSDNKHRESLEKNNTFVENCDKIATRKIKNLRKNGKNGSPVSLKRKNKNRMKLDTADGLNLIKKPRRYALKRQNNTRSIDTLFGNQNNPWDTRKCYSKSLPVELDSEEVDDTCPILLAPPKSSWKLKRQSFSTVKHQNDVERKRTFDKFPDKPQMNGDRGAPKVLKRETSNEFDNRKNRKSKKPSLNVDDNVYTTKKTKGKIVKRAGSRTVLFGPQNMNADAKYKQMFPPNASGNRVKKRFEKEANEFILLDRNEDLETMQNNGHWQFDRSRIRDELRQDQSTGNWYFDRVGNRKSSRMNCNDENQDSRCGAARH